MSKLLSLADLGEVKQGQRERETETEKESERAREKMTDSKIGGEMTQRALQFRNY